MKRDIIRAALVSAGYDGRQADFCRIACIPLRTFARRIRNPDTITVGELRRIDRTAHIDDRELIALIRGGNTHGREHSRNDELV